MSISGALSNALSGLTASSRNAQVISTNLANALTPGYATRTLELVPRAEGRVGGVFVQGVTRHVDAGLLADRRMADSSLANAGAKAGFLTEMERLIGTPDLSSSLSGRFSAFEASLVTAAAKPEEESRLLAVTLRAGELVTALNDVSRGIQQARTEAESQITQAVGEANTYLGQLQSLNAQIVDATNAGHSTASFEDQRRIVIDRLAELVPVRLAQRDNGAVAIYTPGGATLLDGKPAVLEFTASNLVQPHMTLENGLLDGLTINGNPVPPSGDRSPIAGGRIAGLFEQRDSLAPDAQTQIDALARDLISRFQDPALDGTRGPGDAGLFTDEGVAFAAADETGISARISFNALADPDQGGALWRLRDGLGAAAPGDAGDASLLQAMTAALTRPAALASGDLGATARAAAEHVSSFVSRIGQQRLTLDQTVAFASAHQAGLVEIELGMGVDSDAEMQKLLLVEQAYSANARMIQTVEDMIDALLRI
ncbi:MAG: flagellar hook-associated protein FlgK [Roseovarius sp.]